MEKREGRCGKVSRGKRNEEKVCDVMRRKMKGREGKEAKRGRMTWIWNSKRRERKGREREGEGRDK